MNLIKKILGVVWIILGIYVCYLCLFKFGIPRIMSDKQEDLIFGMIILFVLTPIIAGSLIIFGLYVIKGEYGENV